MKNTITRILFTTCAAILILAVYMLIIGNEDIDIITIFQIFAANIIINIGIYFRFKIEIRKFFLEFLIDVSYIIIVLLVFGYIFDWHSYVPVWYLAMMASVIYIIAVITTVVKIKNDTKEINNLLLKRKEKNTNIAS